MTTNKDPIQSSASLIVGLGGNNNITGFDDGTTPKAQVIAGGDVIILRVRPVSLYGASPIVEVRATIGIESVLLATVTLPGLDPTQDPLALNKERWVDIPVSIDYNINSVSNITLSQTNFAEFVDPVTNAVFTQGFWLDSIKRSDGTSVKLDSIKLSDGTNVKLNPDVAYTDEIVGYAVLTATQTPSVAGPAVNKAGNDTLRGGAGDTLLGGGGNDTYFVADRGGDISIIEYDTPGSGVDTVDVVGKSQSSYVLPVNVEKMVYSTALNGDASSKFIGNAAANTITAKDDGVGTVFFGVTLDGLQGDDTLHGGSTSDTIYGGQDRDSVLGHAGDDVLHGDGGLPVDKPAFQAFDDGASDTLIGGLGNDKLYGGNGADYLFDRDTGSTTFIINANVIASIDPARLAMSQDRLPTDSLPLRPGRAELKDFQAAEKYVLFDVYVNGQLIKSGVKVLVGNEVATSNITVQTDQILLIRPEEIKSVKLMLSDRSLDWDGLTAFLGKDDAGNAVNPAIFDVTINSLTVAGQTQTAPSQSVYSYWSNQHGNAVGNTPVDGGGIRFLRDAHISTVVSATYEFQVGGAVDSSLVSQDTMDGGLGDDTYYVDSLGDQVIETDTLDGLPVDGGHDTVLSTISYTAAAGIEDVRLLNMTSATVGDGDALGGKVAKGNALDNVIIGNARDNIIDGAGGNDYLDGGIGADTLVGSTGDNTYVVDNAGDWVLEQFKLDDTGRFVEEVHANTDVDTIISSISFSLTGTKAIPPEKFAPVKVAPGEPPADIPPVNYLTIENLTLSGFAVAGTGNGLNNRLVGNLANNLLIGLGGDDTLSGNGGKDTLRGGVGDDTYILDRFDYVTGEVTIEENAGEGTDTVIFIHGVDRKTPVADAQGVITRGFTFSYTLADVLENIDVGISNSDTSTEESLARNFITGNASANKMTGSVNDDSLSGLGGKDTLYGGQGDDTLDGGADDDALWSESGEDSLLGGIGNDTLYGGQDNDTLDGGEGNDVLWSEDGDDKLLGGNGNDTLYGGQGNDTLDGGDGDDALWSEDGEDSLLGGNGNDTLSVTSEHLSGQVTLAGGVGNDTYIIDAPMDLVVINDDLGVPAGSSTVGDWDIMIASVNATIASTIEELRLNSSTLLEGTGDARGNTLKTTQGAAKLNGLGGNDILIGGTGDDTLVGGTGNDSLVGGDGADTFAYVRGDGVDTIVADGQDSIVFGFGIAKTDVLVGKLGASAANAVVLQVKNGRFTTTDSLTLGNAGGWGGLQLKFADGSSLSGADILTAATKPDDLTVTGTSGKDTLTGGDGNDILSGGKGNDSLVGGLGNDSLNGGEGADTYAYTRGDGADTIVADTFDTIVFTSGIKKTDVVVGKLNVPTANTVVLQIKNGTTATTDSLSLGNAGSWSGLQLKFSDGSSLSGADILAAATKPDNLTLNGTAGSETLTGGGGNDTLNALAGNDTLVGGKGNDSLVGGKGNDTYVFNRGDGLDLIVDYDTTRNNSDLLKLGDATSKQLWFTKAGNNLDIKILGTKDTVTVQSWFVTGGYSQVENITASDGKTLSASKVQALVTAMAGFTPPADATSIPTNAPATVTKLVSSSWV